MFGCFELQRSGKVPGVGLVHCPFSLLPTPFPESHWTQACELTPIFSELVDRVSLDGKFLQESLSRYSLSPIHKDTVQFVILYVIALMCTNSLIY